MSWKSASGPGRKNMLSRLLIPCLIVGFRGSIVRTPSTVKA